MDFTSDWISAHVASWTEHLGHLRGREEVAVCEIGSFEGRSALWFLDNVATGPLSSVFCVDFWPDAPEVERRFDRNTADAQATGKIFKMRGDCWRLANLTQFFDAIYVDGDHQAFAALTDAIVAWRALKVGGVLIFDDYGLRFEGGPGVAVGVDGFLRAAAGRFQFLARGAQVIVRKVRE